MNLLFRSICQLGIFMICAQAIVHFRPNSSYEKYLKMLVSVMLLVQVFLPFTKMFSSDTQQGIEKNIAQFEQKIEETMNQALRTAAETDDLLSNMSLEEVRKRMEAQEEEKEGEQEESSASAAMSGSPVEIEKIEVQIEDPGGDQDSGEEQ